MRPKLICQARLRSFSEKHEVEIAQQRQKAVGVFHFDEVRSVASLQSISSACVRHRTGKKAAGMQTRERENMTGLSDDRNVACLGKEDANDRNATLGMWAQILEWIVVP